MKNQNESKHEQLEKLQEFEFAETRIMAGKTRTGEMIALRPCVENLGISWNGAFEKIKRDSKLNQLFVLEKALGNDGKSYEMICLPPDAFNEWLYNLQPKNYKNFNLELWEYYKKGLVVHILMMLRTALNHIEMNAEENYHNAQLKQKVLEILEFEKQKADLDRQLAEIKKKIKDSKTELEIQALTDPSQLLIEFNNLTK